MANTFSSLWVQQPFLLKSTTIDLLHLGAIKYSLFIIVMVVEML
jgi:hypothetical protein